MSRRYFLTGGNGFIGKALSQELLATGGTVFSFDKDVGDITDIESVRSAINEFKPDVVFHLAAYKARTVLFGDFKSAIDVNVSGTINLFQAINEYEKIEAVICVGTAEEYGLNSVPFKETMREIPISSYSFSKVCVTHLAQIMNKVHNIPTIIVRPSVAYGPGQLTDMFIPALISTLKERKSFKMTDGEQLRDFIYIDDLVSALILIADKVIPSGQVINIGSGERKTIALVARQIEKLIGVSGLLDIGAIPRRKIEIDKYELDCSYLKQELGWSAKVNLELGLIATIKSLK